MQKIGQIKDIFRYPVKSFKGERIESSIVEHYGLRGDRSHVFIDHTYSQKHLSAKRVPWLLGYSACFTEDVTSSNDPDIQVISPKGDVYGWEQALLNEVSYLSGRTLSQKKYPMDHEGLTAVDAANLLIITENSLLAFEKLIGQPLDVRRFRPNLVIGNHDQTPFEEMNWLGKQFKVGDIELEVYQPCERCSMINVNPENLNFDIEFLKTIGKHLKACFGVYAKVKTTGRIQISDEVYIETDRSDE